MPGIFGFIGKDIVSLKCVLSIEEESILHEGGRQGGWGMIFYKAGDILLKSHPFPTKEAGGFLKVLKQAETNTLLGRFEAAAAPPPGKWNMQPFRYRGWVYLQQGKLDGFHRIRERIVAAMPDFLGRSLKGTSDAEALFHLMLSFLFDAGKLDEPNLEPAVIASTMKHTLEFVKRMSIEFGCRPPSVSLLISNGSMLAGYNADQEGQLALYEGRGNCETCNVKGTCKLYRYSESTRSALVMIFKHFPKAFIKKRFSPLLSDTFFVISRDVTFESIPGRISLV